MSTLITRIRYSSISFLRNVYRPPLIRCIILSIPDSSHLAFGCRNFGYFHNTRRLLASQFKFQLQRNILKMPIVTSNILSGKEVSLDIQKQLQEEVELLKEQHPNFEPVLAIVQVGAREDSNVYIRMKKKVAAEVGVTAKHVQLPRTLSESEILSEVQKLNDDPKIHGIIVQLPLDTDSPVDAKRITNAVSPSKDVDGICDENAGRLSHGELEGYFIACTPLGCLELIKRSGVTIKGSKAVVIGRSKIVGLPVALLLLWHHATVTICHSRTQDLRSVVKDADIIVAAVGQAQMVKKDWVKPGAVVIDCGINSIKDETKKSGVPEEPSSSAAPEVPDEPASSAAPEVPHEPASSAAPEVPDDSSSSGDESSASEETASEGDSSSSVDEPTSNEDSSSAEEPTQEGDSSSADESVSSASVEEPSQEGDASSADESVSSASVEEPSQEGDSSSADETASSGESAAADETASSGESASAEEPSQEGESFSADESASSASVEEPSQGGDSSSADESASSGETASAEEPSQEVDSSSADESSSGGDTSSADEPVSSEESAADGDSSSPNESASSGVEEPQSSESSGAEQEVPAAESR